MTDWRRQTCPFGIAILALFSTVVELVFRKVRLMNVNKMVAAGLLLICTTLPLGVFVKHTERAAITTKHPLVVVAPPQILVAKVLVGALHLVQEPVRPKDPLPQGMRPIVWERAEAARQCAIKKGEISARAKIAIIDYDLPSSSKRMWVVDPVSEKVLLRDLVSHGSGSGQAFAHSFSNQEGSLKTSLGLFRIAEAYDGLHGVSLRMDGLEGGFNDQARARGIVMHSAWYATADIVQKTGRLGRSQGCPAMGEQAFGKAQQALKNGGLLFAYASENQWLRRSAYLHCN